MDTFRLSEPIFMFGATELPYMAVLWTQNLRPTKLPYMDTFRMSEPKSLQNCGPQQLYGHFWVVCKSVRRTAKVRSFVGILAHTTEKCP